jgi:hypothetical protein
MRDLRGRSFSKLEEEEDSDPRTGLVNLADVMLVFACGLMLALVSFWNLDVSALKEVSLTNQVKEVKDVEKIKNETKKSGGYQELGVVYKDPMTGKLYVVENGEEENEK